MRAGRLRHRVRFLAPIATPEANGSESIAYTEVFRGWVSIEPIKGAEAMRANQPLEVIDTRIVGRWNANTARVSAKWRLVHRGVIYDVVSAVNVNTRDTDLEIMAKSGAVS